MPSFKEWTLSKLDRTFALEQVPSHPILDAWLNAKAIAVSAFEQQVLLTMREHLQRNVYDWNETELAYNFIGPLIMLVNYTTKHSNFFAERAFGGVVDGIAMEGKPDGMIASGVREPETPYFCFQEYKKEKDPEGDPAGQALAAMLVAQECSEHQRPLYGCYVVGRDWFFMVLQDREYCISEGYMATRDDIFDIFRVLKSLKHIIQSFIETGKK